MGPSFGPHFKSVCSICEGCIDRVRVAIFGQVENRVLDRAVVGAAGRAFWVSLYLYIVYLRSI